MPSYWLGKNLKQQALDIQGHLLRLGMTGLKKYTNQTPNLRSHDCRSTRECNLWEDMKRSLEDDGLAGGLSCRNLTLRRRLDNRKGFCVANGSPKQLDGVFCFFRQGKPAHHWNPGVFQRKCSGRVDVLGWFKSQIMIQHAHAQKWCCFYVFHGSTSPNIMNGHQFVKRYWFMTSISTPTLTWADFPVESVWIHVGHISTYKTWVDSPKEKTFGHWNYIIDLWSIYSFDAIVLEECIISSGFSPK